MRIKQNASIEYFNLYVIAYSFFIPLGVAIQNIGIGIFILLWILDLKSGGQIDKKMIINFFIFVSYCFVILLSFLLSDSKSTGIKWIFRLAPLVIFPLVFFLKKETKIRKSTIIYCVWAFSISLFLVALINFSLLLVKHNFNFSLIKELPGKSFSTGVVNYHYLYLAFYISISVITLLLINVFSLIKNRYTIAGSLLLTIVLFLYLFPLGSRTSLIITLLISSIIYAIWVIKTKKWKSIFIVAVLVISAIGTTYFLNLPVIGKFKEAINYKGEYSSLKKVWGGKMMREEIWYCAVDLISKKPFIGYGPGLVQKKLDECLEKTSEKSVLYLGKFKFNAHNQYLQIALNSGIISLILFSTFLLVTTIFALKRNNYLYGTFIIISALSFLTESILERNHGITIFGFFSCLFYLYNPNSEQD